MWNTGGLIMWKCSLGSWKRIEMVVNNFRAQHLRVFTAAFFNYKAENKILPGYFLG